MSRAKPKPPGQSVTGTEELVTVVFLHGKSYTSRIWDDRKILDRVAQAGWRAVSVDLPGYGDTPELSDDDTGSTISNGTWLRELIGKLGGPGSVVPAAGAAAPTKCGRSKILPPGCRSKMWPTS